MLNDRTISNLSSLGSTPWLARSQGDIEFKRLGREVSLLAKVRLKSSTTRQQKIRTARITERVSNIISNRTESLGINKNTCCKSTQSHEFLNLTHHKIRVAAHLRRRLYANLRVIYRLLRTAWMGQVHTLADRYRVYQINTIYSTFKTWQYLVESWACLE